MPHMSVDTARITWLHTPNVNVRCAARRVGILLFDRFGLLGAGIVAEMFHTANEIATAHGGDDPPYEVQFLSMEGGSVASSQTAQPISASKCLMSSSPDFIPRTPGRINSSASPMTGCRPSMKALR